MDRESYESALNVAKSDLIPVTAPDADEVAELVSKAKGDGRSLREFAEDTGISAPTLSRIMNAKITRPLTLETIVTIVGNSEHFTLRTVFDLARANGYMSKAEQGALRARQQLHAARNSTYAVTKEYMRTAVLAELFQRGGEMNRNVLETNPGTLCTALEQAVKYDFSMHVNLDGEEYDWIFFAFPMRTEDFKSSGVPADRLARKLVTDLSPVFLTDAWLPAQYENRKISFCFVDQDIYSAFVNITDYGKLNNSFTAILLDEETAKLIEEHTYQTAKHHDSVFDLPLRMAISFEDDDVADEVGEYNYLFVEEGDED